MDFIGHENTKERIEVAVSSAVKRNTALPHMMLAGAAGCGKTTTARWLATMGDYEYLSASPLELKTRKDVYNLLEKLNMEGYDKRGNRINKIKPTILFFDEIHQMSVVIQEVLGLAMEDFMLETDIPNKLIWLPYFTIVGATTDDGKLTKPFRDRFKLKFIYEPYTDEAMNDMVRAHAVRNKLPITENAVCNITKRSRGVPRVMVNSLDTIRDIMLSKNAEIITTSLVNIAFQSMGIDKTGLSKVEIKILLSLFKTGFPIGLDNLAIITNESPKTISQTLEPFLIRRGLIIRTSKGRDITDNGIKYLEDYGYLSSKTNNKAFISANYVRK